MASVFLQNSQVGTLVTFFLGTVETQVNFFVSFKMSRKRERKTETRYNDIRRDAYEEVKRGTSKRRAVEMHEINRMTLL